MEKNDGIFGLLTFVNNDEFNSFKNDINNLLKKGNYINDNINYTFNNDTFNNDICICNISKEAVPCWVNNVVKKINTNELKNHTHYRIILIKYIENIYYFERNGNINVFDILNKYAFDLFKKTKWDNVLKETKLNNLSFQRTN